MVNENIVIFQYGINENNSMITKDALDKAIDNFKNIPVFEYNSNDLYNKESKIIGFISNVRSYIFPYVYGDVVTFNSEKIMQFKNYEAQIEESHEENGMFVVDKFRLVNVGFDVR